MLENRAFCLLLALILTFARILASFIIKTCSTFKQEQRNVSSAVGIKMSTNSTTRAKCVMATKQLFEAMERVFLEKDLRMYIKTYILFLTGVVYRLSFAKPSMINIGLLGSQKMRSLLDLEFQHF